MSSGASFVPTAISGSVRADLPSEQLREETLASRLFLLMPATALGGRNPAHDLVNVLATARPRRLLALFTCHRTAHLLAPSSGWIVPSVYPMGY